jgi:hypothetical protein
VSERSLEVAGRLFRQAVEVLRDAAGQAASEADLLGVLTLGEGVRRALDQVGVAALADLERRGTFSERGYAPARPRWPICSGGNAPRPEGT